MKNHLPKLTIMILCMLIYGSTLFAQHECTTNCNVESNFDEAAFQKFRNEQSLAENNEVDSIPIRIHQTRRTDGSGLFVTEQEIIDQLAITNNHFAGANFVFYLCGDINYIDDDKYYFLSGEERNELADLVQDERVVNIYVSYLSPCFSTLPGPDRNYIFAAYGCITNNTFSHELGHFFGLIHTFVGYNGNSELVDGSNCNTAGDLICDTPADPYPNSNYDINTCEYLGTAVDANGDFYAPDITNIMSYYNACLNQFSPQQLELMQFQKNTYFDFSCPPPNPATYCDSEGMISTEEWISNVKISRTNQEVLLDNTSGQEGYGDFTDQIITLNRKNSYDLNLTVNYNDPSYLSYLNVWIDYNQDNTFQDPEELALVKGIPNTGSVVNYSTNLVIPEELFVGETRMRITFRRTFGGLPCDQFTYGEVEDYTINFIEALPSCEGGPLFPSQFDVDAFPSCTVFDGSIQITGYSINNIDALNSLEEITGDLYIQNTNITDVNGLSNLKKIGGRLRLIGNIALTNISSLSNLTTIGNGIEFSNLINLTSLDGLQNLESISTGQEEGLLFIEMTKLNNLDELNGVEGAPDLINIKDNLFLNDISGLSSIVQGINRIEIFNNPALLSLNGLENFTVGGNDGIDIQNNSSLSDCCGLYPRLVLGNLPNEVLLQNNILGCNSVEAILENCDIPTGSYCDAQGTSPWQEWIAGLELNTIDNPSGKCDGICGYSDFTSLSTDLEIGASYTLDLAPGKSWSGHPADLYWRVWVDINMDGDFEDNNEQLLEVAGGNQLVSGTILIPMLMTNPGITRMRVAAKRGGFADPCETFERGEVEDYTVNFVQGNVEGNLIISEVACPDNYPNPGVDLTWSITLMNTGNGFTAPTDIYLYNQSFQVPAKQLYGSTSIPALMPGENITVNIVAPSTAYFPNPENAGAGEDYIYRGVKFLSFDPDGNTMDYLEGDGLPNIYCKTYSTDLAIELTPITTSISGVEPVTFLMTVTNKGPERAFSIEADVATGVASLGFPIPQVSADVSKGALWTNISPGGGSTPYNYFWYLPILEVGEIVTAEVTIDPITFIPSESGVNIRRTVSSGHNIDPDESNNFDLINIPFETETGEYCESKGEAPWQEWIAGVQLNNVNNPSGKCDGVCGYTDFTNVSIDLEAGFSNYIVVLEPGKSWPGHPADLYWRIWIDFNQDGDFTDANELALETYGGNETVLEVLAIPADVMTGETRMRIAAKRGAYANPCETFARGEVEDYTVHINGDPSGIVINCPEDITIQYPLTLFPAPPPCTDGYAVPFPEATSTCTVGSIDITLDDYNIIDGNIEVVYPADVCGSWVYLTGFGTIELNIKASDECGDMVTCSYEITLEELPHEHGFVDCPIELNYTVEEGQDGLAVDYLTPFYVESNCPPGYLPGPVELISGLPSGSFFPIGTSVAVYQQFSCYGFIDQCTVIVTVSQSGEGEEYCDASADRPWQEWISEVSFSSDAASMTNASGKCDVICGYADYTNLSALSEPGYTNTISLTPGLSWSGHPADFYWRVWVDYNQDGDFDDFAEKVLEVNGGSEVVNGTFVTLPSAAQGTTRMRVAAKKGGYPESCENFEKGEVEDYSFTVGASIEFLEMADASQLFFNALKNGQSTLLNWTRTTNHNNAYFVLERSFDGEHFEALQEVESTEEVATTYRYVDETPQAGINYYRLQSVFTDGRIVYSSVKTVSFAIDQSDLSLFPNPTSQKLYASIPKLISQGAHFEIYNQLGQVMLDFDVNQLTAAPIEFDVSNFRSGMYFLSIQVAGQKTISQKFIITKQ